MEPNQRKLDLLGLGQYPNKRLELCRKMISIESRNIEDKVAAVDVRDMEDRMNTLDFPLIHLSTCQCPTNAFFMLISDGICRDQPPSYLEWYPETVRKIGKWPKQNSLLFLSLMFLPFISRRPLTNWGPAWFLLFLCGSQCYCILFIYSFLLWFIILSLCNIIPWSFCVVHGCNPSTWKKPGS